MPAILSDQQLQRRSHLFLLFSWATALWAGVCFYLSWSHVDLTGALALLEILSGLIAVLGGCVGCIYLIAGARTWRAILSGAAATAANLGYIWWYANAIFHQ
jgi:hypothetical protein